MTSGTSGSFRFAVNMLTVGPRSEWQAKARQVEDLGYDVLQVPDHVAGPAPFPALVSAGEVTTIRLGTFVLNAPLHRAALLARDAISTDQLTGGRLELGLGAGYLPADFEAAELPFPGPGERVERLTHVVRELRRLFASNGQQPGHRRSGPPLMVAGDGDRVLRLAAREADIVAFSGDAANKPGADPQRALADRVAFVRGEAGDRARDLELNLFVSTVAVTGSGEPDLGPARMLAPQLTDEQILQLPTVLAGSEQQIAETLLAYRETYGITYFSVLEPYMGDFAKVIGRLR